MMEGSKLADVEGFHHQVYRRIAGNKSLRDGYGEWEWPPVEESLVVIWTWIIK